MTYDKIAVVALAAVLVSCSSNMTRLFVSTGIGCGAGLALGTVYDEVERKKEGKDRKRLENQIFNVFKKRKEHNQGKIVGLATGCLAGLGTGLYLNIMHEDIQANFKDKGINLEKETGKNGETKALLVKMDGGISFENDKSDLKGVAKSNIDKLSEALSAYPETNVQITGHGNQTGSETRTAELSQERAVAAKEALVDDGVDSGRILEAKGESWNDPLPGKNPKDPENRRVEIRILGKS